MLLSSSRTVVVSVDTLYRYVPHFVGPPLLIFVFFFNDTATTEIYTLSLHDALPICEVVRDLGARASADTLVRRLIDFARDAGGDRKSTRLNSSHGYISYAVFCLKKKKKTMEQAITLDGAAVLMMQQPALVGVLCASR